jgi:hypothetical protein
MALITDPDDLNAGALTSPTDAAWSAAAQVATITSALTQLPTIAAGDFFEVRDHSVPANNGLYVETGGSPSNGTIIATHLTDTPATAGAEAVSTYGTTATPLSIMYDTKGRDVWLVEQGNLSTDGVTMLAVHSRLKDDWKADATLPPHPFPMIGIDFDAGKWEIGGDPSGNFSGWMFADTISSPVANNVHRLIRNAGWNAYYDDGSFRRKFFNITTLGTFEDAANDTAYYRFGNDPTDTGAAVDVEFAGPVNEAVKFYDAEVTRAVVTPNGYDFTDGGGGDDSIDRNDGGSFITDGYVVGGQIEVSNATTPANNGTYTITTVAAGSVGIPTASITADTDDNTATLAIDNSNSFDLFLRVRDADPKGKTFSQADLSSAGETAIVNKVIKFPLSNEADQKIDETDANIAVNSPYTQINIKYFDQAYARDGLTGGPYNYGIVVDVGTHSLVDGSAPGAASVLTSAEGGINQFGATAYNGGTLYCHEGTDVGVSWPIVSHTDTTVTVTGTIASVTNGSFHLQRSSPVTATQQEIYEKVQYSLRQAADIDNTDQTVTGKTADELAGFVGDNLSFGPAIPENPNGGGTGVIVEGFDANDTNTLFFYDNTGVSRNYPFVAAGTITWNANLYPDDASPEFWMFFQYTTRTNLSDGAVVSPSGDSYDLESPGSNLPTLAVNDYIRVSGFAGSANNGYFQVDVINVANQDYTISRVDGENVGAAESGVTIDVDENPVNTADAIVVNDNSGSPIEGVIGASSTTFDFDYEANVQGGRTADTDATIVIRAIGTDKAQFVETDPLVITKNTGLAFSVVAALERNYSNP